MSQVNLASPLLILHRIREAMKSVLIGINRYFHVDPRPILYRLRHLLISPTSCCVLFVNGCLRILNWTYIFDLGEFQFFRVANSRHRLKSIVLEWMILLLVFHHGGRTFERLLLPPINRLVLIMRSFQVLCQTYTFCRKVINLVDTSWFYKLVICVSMKVVLVRFGLPLSLKRIACRVPHLLLSLERVAGRVVDEPLNLQRPSSWVPKIFIVALICY